MDLLNLSILKHIEDKSSCDIILIGEPGAGDGASLFVGDAVLYRGPIGLCHLTVGQGAPLSDRQSVPDRVFAAFLEICLQLQR